MKKKTLLAHSEFEGYREKIVVQKDKRNWMEKYGALSETPVKPMHKNSFREERKKC